MRWWVLSIFFMFPLVSLFTYGSSPIGQTSSSEWIDELHLSDCELPCFIGIVPGSTTLAEAKAQVETIYTNTSFYDVSKWDYQWSYVYRIIHRPTGYQVGITLRSDDGDLATQNSIVQTIYLHLLFSVKSPITYPTISELQSVLGEPDAVRLASGSETPKVVLLYREQRVHISVEELECDRVLPNQQIQYIALYNEPPTNIAWLSKPQEWLGFDYCYNFEPQIS